MAKNLEREVNKGKLIDQQFSEWKSGGYEHLGYYFSNIIKILVGKEPSHVSPNNRVVNADLGDY